MALPPKTWVEVSRSALQHNATVLKRGLAPGTSLMAVVKSNAYGHGLPETVRALRTRVHWFGVDSVLEADVVRHEAPRAHILMLGTTIPAWTRHAATAGYRFSISTPQAAQHLARSKCRAIVHLEIETGLTRQGIEPGELASVVRILHRAKGVIIEGLFTHFANVDVDGFDHPYTQKQITNLVAAEHVAEHVLGRSIPLVHTACSAPGLLFPKTHFGIVRAGIALYGYWPSQETMKRAKRLRPGLTLKPVMTWKTTVAQVKSVAKGTSVGYGRKTFTKRAGRVAVLPIGYWDGYDRGFGSCGQVVFRGRQAPIIGRICMNMCMVDVSRVPGVSVGDAVVLLGGKKPHLSAETHAAQLGTNTYEVLTRINPLIPRVLV